MCFQYQEIKTMAIFHMSAQTISRSKGHSSVAAAAYRHGEKLMDEHTGEIHDYSKK
ncbi:MobA/MobL family protein, partial [Escherichia coli]